MSAEVAHPHSGDQYESRAPSTPDSIDQELDWLIEKEEKEISQDRTDSPEDRHEDSPDKTMSPEPTSPRDDDHEEKRKIYHSADTHFPREKTPSPQSSPRRSEGSPSKSPDDEKQDGDDLELSDDQRQALNELNNMKLDLGYTEEDPPEYDVSERVRQLNEELANDPEPDEDRERAIKFKDNLVDLVAPPPDDSEDEQGDQQEGPEPVKSEEDTPRSSEDQQSPGRTDSDEGSPRSTDNEEDTIQKVHDSQNTQDDEKIVVERNGKFEYLSASELTAEERELYGVDEPSESSDSKQKNGHDPRPPDGPRPNTANGGSHRKKSSSEPRRTQSAQDHHYKEWDENFTYQSPYALTPEQKKEMAKKQREEQKQKMEEDEKKRRDKNKQKDESDEAFSAWLRKKRESQSQRKKEDGERRKKEDEESESNKRDPEGAYDSWCKTKKEQSKKEKDEEKRKNDMYDEGWYVRPRKQCETAFREWLKKKNEDKCKQKTDDKQRARLHKLLARRSRKSQQLARAIKQAQAFRYVDYYGYRF